MKVTNFTLPMLSLTWRLIDTLYDGSFDKFSGKVLAINETSDFFKPVYCIFETKESLFVISRGTWDQNDIATDIEMVEKNTKYGTFYDGFYRAAEYVYKYAKPFISTTSKPIYYIGHSYGGAVSNVLHVMAAQDFPGKDHNTIAYAPVPAIDLEMNKTYGEKIATLVNENDIVPTVSLPNIYKRISFCFVKKYTKDLTIKVLIAALKCFEYITHQFSGKVVNAIIASVPTVIDQLYDYRNGKPLKVYYVPGTIYGISHKKSMILSQNVIDATKSLNILKITISGCLDHEPPKYSAAVKNIQKI